MGQDKDGQGIDPPYPRAPGKSGRGSQPNWADHHEDLEAKESLPCQVVACGTLSVTVHLIIKKPTTDYPVFGPTSHVNSFMDIFVIDNRW
jgi:hypothetical protein